MISLNDVSYTYDERRAGKRGASSPSGDGTAGAWGTVPEDVWALTDVNLTIEDGEFVGIAGHTGSGKSTLIQHMNGLLHPTTGTVTVDGVDIVGRAEAEAARAGVGLVFQYAENQLFADTVFDDVAFGPRNMGLSDDEVASRVRAAIADVGLDFADVADRSPFELSGGQQRRVAFAGVLSMRPQALILDEPVAGLDPAARANFLDLIETLHRERHMTIVMVSHSMDDLARLCDRIVVLDRGRIVLTGSPTEVFADEEALRRIGLGVPEARHLALRLRARGVQLDERLYDIDGLADAIAALPARPSKD